MADLFSENMQGLCMAMVKCAMVKEAEGVRKMMQAFHAATKAAPKRGLGKSLLAAPFYRDFHALRPIQYTAAEDLLKDVGQRTNEQVFRLKKMIYEAQRNGASPDWLKHRANQLDRGLRNRTRRVYTDTLNSVKGNPVEMSEMGELLDNNLHEYGSIFKDHIRFPYGRGKWAYEMNLKPKTAFPDVMDGSQLTEWSQLRGIR